MDLSASTSRSSPRMIHQLNQSNTINHNAQQLPRLEIPFSESPSAMNHQQYGTPPPANSSPHTQSQQQSTRRSPGFFVYPEKIINEGISVCKKSLLGKIITNKPIHINSIQMGLENIWGSPPGLKIHETKGKILQFFMDEVIDQERILLGNPWIFRNSWLIIHPWDRNTDPTTLDFDHAPTWIQLWGLPAHCKTKQMGISIGELLGNVEAAETYEYPGKKLIIKIKVAINVHKPINPGILIGNAKDGTHWIDFRYENLPLFCFICGLVGHAENLCQNKDMAIESETPLGPWLRSNQYGRRVLDAKDRKFHSNPSLGKNFGSYSSSIPAEMMKQMAAMQLQEDIEAGHPPKQGSEASQGNNPESHMKTYKSCKSVTKGSVETIQTEIVQNSIVTQAKRQRTDSICSTDLISTMEDTYMAGPAEQASQPQ
ncbi:hypothetical protein QL285_030612 [Trifolium repens]|nr:hypothetical protein QL285_030612 [Trifolium repens]